VITDAIASAISFKAVKCRLITAVSGYCNSNKLIVTKCHYVPITMACESDI
jgi:hypothetical protein